MPINLYITEKLVVLPAFPIVRLNHQFPIVLPGFNYLR